VKLGHLVVALPLIGGGCAGVPAAAVWTGVGAGLGYVASVNNLATEIIKTREEKPSP
jgi:hypothetical protein